MNAQTLDSRITAVHVFRQGATVERQALLNEPRQESLIQMTGLPLGLLDRSVRVRPAAGFFVSSVRVSIEPATNNQADEASVQAIDDAKRALAVIEADLAELERSTTLLSNLRFSARNSSPLHEPKPTQVGARLALARFSTEHAQELFGERTRLQRERARARAVLFALQQKQRKALAQLCKVARVTLRARNSELPSECELSLSYFVKQAGWAPCYTLRIDPAASRASLEHRAMVRQSSGEDWSSVALTVSTADVGGFHPLRALTSLRVGRRQSSEGAIKRAPADPSELFADYARFKQAAGAPAPPPPPPPPPAPEPEAEEAGYLADMLQVSAAPSMASLSQPGFAVRASAPAVYASAPAYPPQGMGMGAPPLAKRRMMADAPARSAPGGMLKERDSESYGGGPEAPTLRETVVEVVDPRLLAYDELRMPLPSAQRGRLTLLSRAELFAEVADQSLDQQAALTAALGREQAELDSRLAPHCRPPQAEQGFHHRLVSEARVSVPSDDGFHSVPLLQAEGSCRTVFVVVPRESTDVFRRVELMNPFDVPLLAGPCDVYTGSVAWDYLLTTEIETVPPRGELHVGVGVEQAIRVVRNTRFAESSEGLIGGTAVLSHEIKIELENHLAQPCTLEVRERVPVPFEKEEQIRVDVGEVKPAWTPLRAHSRESEVRGAYAWRLELAPAARAELRANYTIRIPSKLELVSGNRRE